MEVKEPAGYLVQLSMNGKDLDDSCAPTPPELLVVMWIATLLTFYSTATIDHGVLIDFLDHRNRLKPM
jgi:hypothetical protein